MDMDKALDALDLEKAKQDYLATMPIRNLAEIVGDPSTTFPRMDRNDWKDFKDVMEAYHPDYEYSLLSDSPAVGGAMRIKHPDTTFEVLVYGKMNLMEMIKKLQSMEECVRWKLFKPNTQHLSPQ